MSTDLSYVVYVTDQAHLPGLTYKKMFGEYALYLDTKVIAFVCDNQVYVKPTAGARALLDEVREAPPYPGAKMYYLLDTEIDKPDLLQQIFVTTAHALPLPKPKKKKTAEG